MLAFSKSSCCPICPHMASVAHSVCRSHLKEHPALFWIITFSQCLACSGVWANGRSETACLHRQSSASLHTCTYQARGSTSSCLPLLTCVGGIREHFCLAALTSTWQPLLSRLEFKKCIDGVISINWYWCLQTWLFEIINPNGRKKSLGWEHCII